MWLSVAICITYLGSRASVALIKLRTLGLHEPSFGRSRFALIALAMVAASVSPIKGYLPWNLVCVCVCVCCVLYRINTGQGQGYNTHMIKVMTPTALERWCLAEHQQ